MKQIKTRESSEKEGFKNPVFEYRTDWPYISIGFGDERDYFIENLSLLISSGMGILSALEAVKKGVKSRRMKKITIAIEEMVTAGMPLWKAFKMTDFLPDRIISLVRSGEESGRLPEHLNLVTIQQHKEKIFKSRLKSALLYPGIVLLMAIIIGLGSSWVVLPTLVSIFNQSTGVLPISTRILIWLGVFLKSYGIIFIPGIIILICILIYLFYFNKKTRFIGDYTLFIIPGIKKLVQGVEMARFGYIGGALLQAGFQVSETLMSIKEGTDYRAYSRFYDYLAKSIEKGESFNGALSKFPNSDRYIPSPIQQLIMSAEKSGRLPETLIKIGIIFEEKTEAMSQDLATILEPIILIIVGLIVGFVVSGILGPIYGISQM
jgi:type II secretory pathway component PulF